MRTKLLLFATFSSLFLAAGDDMIIYKPKALRVSSSSFEAGNPLPQKHAYKHENLSPHIEWSAVPSETESVVIICDDPDAPHTAWTHWIVYNIQPNLTQLPEGANLPRINLGYNDYGTVGYGGPCPPSGTHRYFFKVYALDKRLHFAGYPKKEDVEKAMERHIIAKGTIMGTYSA